MFSPTSYFNQRLSASAPIDANSATVVGDRNSEGSLVWQAIGTIASPKLPSINFRDWSTSIYIAGPNAPTVPVTIDSVSATEAQIAAFSAVPIPPGARPPGPFPGDNHLVIYQPSTDKMWELYKASQFEVDGPNSVPGVSEEKQHLPGWHCKWGGAVYNLSTNPGYFEENSLPGAGAGQKLSATASGIFLLGLAITPAEAQRLYIPHAIGITIRENFAKDTFRWPAIKTDGTHPEWLTEEGMCFRFPSSRTFSDVADPFIKAVCVAIRDYGAYVFDKGGDVSIRCKNESRIPNSRSDGTDAWKGPEDKYGGAGAILSANPTTLMQEAPWADLQLVDASYRPSSIAPGMLPVGG